MFRVPGSPSLALACKGSMPKLNVKSTTALNIPESWGTCGHPQRGRRTLTGAWVVGNGQGAPRSSSEYLPLVLFAFMFYFKHSSKIPFRCPIIRFVWNLFCVFPSCLKSFLCSGSVLRRQCPHPHPHPQPCGGSLTPLIPPGTTVLSSFLLLSASPHSPAGPKFSVSKSFFSQQ